MGKYQNGIETKERILELCRRLFYEKGYEATTFKEISDTLGINQSAIHYHFKSKENILRIIHSDTGRANNRTVLENTTDENSYLAKMLFDLRVYLYKVWNDEKYRKFYIAATENWYEIDKLDSLAPSELSYNKYFAIRNSDSAFKVMACSAFDQAVLRLIDTKKEVYTLDEVFNQNADMYRKILDIPVAEYVAALRELETIEDKFDWKNLKINLDGVKE